MVARENADEITKLGKVPWRRGPRALSPQPWSPSAIAAETVPGLACCWAVCLAVVASCGTGGARAPSGSGAGGVGASGGSGSVSGGSGGAGTAGAGGVTNSAGNGGGVMVATAGSNGAFLMPPALNAAATTESAGVLGLRRLTAREYSNTVADLLGLSVPRTEGSPFPDDQLSTTGFVAPNSVTALDTQLVAESAERLATAAMAGGAVVAVCAQPTVRASAIQCASEFIQSFGRRAFRRPVAAEEAADLLDLFAAARDGGFDFRTALTYVVSAMLQSPNFLYHWEIGDEPEARAGGLIVLPAHQVASRLSYFLWQTMPDETLFAAADANQLSTPEQILGQATRMLADPARSREGMATFHEQWLRVDRLDGLLKDPVRYPAFTAALADAFGEELRLFVSSVLGAAGDGTLKTLLTSPRSYANDSLAALYGVTVAGNAFSPIQLNPVERAGILTQAAFLATNATATLTDPVQRGHLIWQRLLCGSAGSPAPHPADHLPGPVVATAPNRDRYARLSEGSCADCHKSFDGLGFAFENYDAVGAYQSTDNGVPVNTGGEAVTPGGNRISFKNAIELVNGLADNDEVKWCVTRHWFRYLLGRMDSPADVGSMERAYRAGAAASGYSLRDMLMATVQTIDFRYRAPSP